ncbi:MAG: ABC transporter permease subunit [Acetatifactor sp.]|nr:ABC transporter permease subunit [Acetatifactor sp.]
MWTITKREFRNYLRNPLWWAGLIVIICFLSQMLFPYLDLHYFQPGTEFAELPVESLGDADVMNGYIPSSKERQMADTYRQIGLLFTEEFGYSQEETDRMLAELEEMEPSVPELEDWLAEHSPFCYSSARYLMDLNELHRGSAEEVNAYISEKMSEHPYSYYLARKFADFGGLFMGFFAVVLLAFLYIRDTGRDTWELLHTKPVSPSAYILGKVMGGFLSMLAALGILNLIFGVTGILVGNKNGLPVNFLDFPAASLLYIVPNLLMIVCFYTIISLLFKSPYPAVPLLFLYQVYSNMGSLGPDGRYGYYGRPLAIMVRFPGRFLDTAPPPLVLWNQLFLIAASAGIIGVSIRIWRRRRVY